MFYSLVSITSRSKASSRLNSAVVPCPSFLFLESFVFTAACTCHPVQHKASARRNSAILNSFALSFQRKWFLGGTHTRHRTCILVNSELLGTDQQTPNWRRCVPLYKLRMQTLHYDTLLMTETEEVLFSLLISLDRVTLIEKSYLKPCWSQLQKEKPAIHWAKVSTSRLNSAFVPCLSFLL